MRPLRVTLISSNENSTKPTRMEKRLSLFDFVVSEIIFLFSRVFNSQIILCGTVARFREKYFHCETVHLHFKYLPVNSLTSAFVCFVLMHKIKRPKIIHWSDLVRRCIGTRPLIDGHPIAWCALNKSAAIHEKLSFSFLSTKKYYRRIVCLSHHLNSSFR